jgi:hypothetical protein
MDGYSIKDLAERDNATFQRNKSNIIEGYYAPTQDRINAHKRINNYFIWFSSLATLILILWCEYGI